MIVRVEREKGVGGGETTQLAAAVKDALKKVLLVTPEVEITDYGSLPRSERKTKRVFDKRDA